MLIYVNIYGSYKVQIHSPVYLGPACTFEPRKWSRWQPSWLILSAPRCPSKRNRAKAQTTLCEENYWYIGGATWHYVWQSNRVAISADFVEEIENWTVSEIRDSVFCNVTLNFFTQTWLRYIRVFAIANPSVACNARAPYSRETLKLSAMFLRHFVPWPSFDLHAKFLRRSSQGNPSIGGVNARGVQLPMSRLGLSSPDEFLVYLCQDNGNSLTN